MSAHPETFQPADLKPQIKERPIIFSGEMVRAILAGNKTQTRRVIKPQPTYDGKDWWWNHRNGAASKNTLETLLAAKPVELTDHYGDVGDCLWVREAGKLDTDSKRIFIYAATPGVCRVKDRAPDEDYHPAAHAYKPVSPIYMPRWASRLTLEITEVRVERLQDITDADAIAEGCDDPTCESISIAPGFMREVFKGGWDYLNSKRGFEWDSNPWVWVISFKRIEQ